MTALPAHAIGPRLCRNDGMDGLRAQALAEIDTHLDNLKRCIHWLVAEGVVIISVDMRRGRLKPTIEVAPSPWLHQIFKDVRSHVGAVTEGELTTDHWSAVRHGCSIRWGEVRA